MESCSSLIPFAPRESLYRDIHQQEEDNMKEEMPERCISCGITLTGVGGTRFPCPSCGTVIARCNRCKKQSNVYTCKACGFSGP